MPLVQGWLGASGNSSELIDKNEYSYSQYGLGGDGKATAVADITLHVKTTYSLSEISSSRGTVMSSWERELRSFGQGVENLFGGDGDNMQGVA